MLATVPQGLRVLQELRGQGDHLGGTARRPRRIPAQSQPDTAQVGLPRAHIWAWGATEGAGAIQEGRQ